MLPQKKYLLFLILLIIYSCSSSLFAQSQKTDSLRAALSLAKDDTNKVNLLNALARELSTSNPDTAILLSSQALKTAEKLKWKKGMANSLRNLGTFSRLKGNYSLALNYFNQALSINRKLNDKKGISATLGNIGIVYLDQGDYHKALEHYFKALEIANELGDKGRIAIWFGNIGNVYYSQGDYPRALEHYFKALEIDQELGNKSNISAWLGSIGNVYLNQGNYSRALEHYFKALEIAQELGDKNGIARHLGNIGNVYYSQGDYPKALEHYFKALEIANELGDKSGIVIWFGNIGIVYKNQGDYPKVHPIERDSLLNRALEHSFKALEIAKELGDKSGIAIKLGNIGSLYIAQKRYADAENYLQQAIALSDSIGVLYYLMDQEKSIATLYAEAPVMATAEGRKSGTQNGTYSLAIKHYEKYLQAKDTIFNEEKSKSMGKLEGRHEFALIEMEMARKQKEEQVAAAVAVKRRDKIQFAGLAAVLLVVVLIVSLILFSKFNIAPRIKTGSLFIALMLLFEFALVWFDPSIEKFTGGNPAYKLFINAMLALGFYFVQQTMVKFLSLRQISASNPSQHISSFFIFLLVVPHLCAFAPLRDTSLFSHKDTKSAKLDSLKLLLSQYEIQTATLRSQNKIKDAYETLKKYGVAKDTLQKMEQSQEESKIMERHAMELQKVKEKQEADEKAKYDKEKKERKDLLIYSIILIGIILLFIAFSVTGKLRKGKFAVPQRVLQGGLFVSFLLMFEFILVFADPYIEQFTGGAPAWKFGFNIVMAALIFPVHAWMEEKMRRRIISK